MNEAWPRQMEFGHDGTLQPPFALEVVTPSGGFQPVRAAKINLNGVKVAEIAWPGERTATMAVELVKVNRIELELDGPTFGSIEVTVRGTRGTSRNAFVSRDFLWAGVFSLIAIAFLSGMLLHVAQHPLAKSVNHRLCAGGIYLFAAFTTALTVVGNLKRLQLLGKFLGFS